MLWHSLALGLRLAQDVERLADGSAALVAFDPLDQIDGRLSTPQPVDDPVTGALEHPLPKCMLPIHGQRVRSVLSSLVILGRRRAASTTARGREIKTHRDAAQPLARSCSTLSPRR